MTTKEFISRITDGTLLDNDIALYASKCVDVRVLLNDLYLAKIALDDITGKRYVKNHKEECLLDNAIGVIEKVFNVHYVEVEEESEDIPLPVELNTEKAQIFFKRAIKTGLITEIKPGTSYKFQGSKTLLSYFCGKIFYIADPKPIWLRIGRIRFAIKFQKGWILCSNIFILPRISADILWRNYTHLPRKYETRS